MNYLEIIRQSTINGNVLILPDTQLDRKDYEDVAKALNGIGGKWDRKSKGFLFKKDPTEMIDKILGGEKINIKKDFQFFETPDSVIEIMIRKIRRLILPDYPILEPSAGTGNIIRKIQQKYGATFDCCEIQEDNIEILKGMDGVNFLGPNFLELETEKRYNLIIANPPFSNGQDVEHISKMYDLLEPNGQLIVISSPTWLSSENKKPKELRKKLFGSEAIIEIAESKLLDFQMALADEPIATYLPTDSFKEYGTKVNTCILNIEK